MALTSMTWSWRPFNFGAIKRIERGIFDWNTNFLSDLNIVTSMSSEVVRGRFSKKYGIYTNFFSALIIFSHFFFSLTHCFCQYISYAIPLCSTRISKVSKCAAFQLWTPTYLLYLSSGTHIFSGSQQDKNLMYFPLKIRFITYCYCWSFLCNWHGMAL